MRRPYVYITASSKKCMQKMNELLIMSVDVCACIEPCQRCQRVCLYFTNRHPINTHSIRQASKQATDTRHTYYNKNLSSLTRPTLHVICKLANKRTDDAVLYCTVRSTFALMTVIIQMYTFSPKSFSLL